MSLGRDWRLVLDNRSGFTLGSAVVIKYRRWKFDSSGILTYETTEQSVSIGSGLTNNNTAASSAITNTGAGEFYLGADFKITFPAITGTPVAGNNIGVYMQVSTDAGSTFADIVTNLVSGLPLVVDAYPASTNPPAFARGARFGV